jgi:hypothetical protein
MTVALPYGTYPFIDRRLPLTDLQMLETPPALEPCCAGPRRRT